MSAELFQTALDELGMPLSCMEAMLGVTPDAMRAPHTNMG